MVMANDRPQASQDSDISEDSDLEMGSQKPELVPTSPTTTHYFLYQEPQVSQYFLDETARARAAWSALDTFPQIYLLIIGESFGDSKSRTFSNLSICSYQRDFPEPGSDSDFESPSTPPSPSNPDELNKTWEQVRANNTEVSNVSA